MNPSFARNLAFIQLAVSVHIELELGTNLNLSFTLIGEITDKRVSTLDVQLTPAILFGPDTRMNGTDDPS